MPNRYQYNNPAATSSFVDQNANSAHSFKKNSPVPMETDSSRSRLTLNKKVLNNTEAINKTEKNLEDEDMLLNFLEVIDTPEKT